MIFQSKGISALLRMYGPSGQGEKVCTTRRVKNLECRMIENSHEDETWVEIVHWSKFRPQDLLVKEFVHWLLVVRIKQVTLGSAVMLLKRPVESMAEVSSDEFSELPRVCAFFEDRARSLWGAERFNYVAA